MGKVLFEFRMAEVENQLQTDFYAENAEIMLKIGTMTLF
jgi:hypothetical protein